MTIYAVIIDSRYSEPEAHLFSTAEKAINYAQSVMDDNKEDAKYLNPKNACMTDKELTEAGWLFYGCYSIEGDCVWALPLEVDSDTI